MTNASIGPTAPELFRKWQAFLDGDPARATSLVAAAPPDVIGPLQRLIDDYFESHPTEANSTDGGPAGPEPVPVIPGYTILERLGRGGMGEVYRVRDALDREHALKVARRRQLSVAGRERFKAEARAMAKLSHPNVVRVGHFDDFGGRPYFEMDLYPSNLADRLTDYTGDPQSAVRLMAQVAAGVGHLHEKGFVHRDLKPSNILLTADGRPLVSDFGLIKGPTDNSEVRAGDSGVPASAETNETGARRSQTVAGMILGTRRYMAPDQAAGLNHQAGPAWDVWALGVMLHELLTGQPPRSSAAPERLVNPVEPDNPPATRIKRDLHPELGRIVDTCLARNPADRYPNGAAVAADLSRWLYRARRHWMMGAAIGVLLLLTAGTITAAMNWRRGASAEQTLADIQKEFRKGNAVEVIGATGKPRWFEVVASGGSRPYESEADGTFRVSTEEVTLIDLPPLGVDRYRFEVQVRQESADPTGEFGAYAGRHRLPTIPGDEVHSFVTIWFNEKANFKDHVAGQATDWTAGARWLKEVPGQGSVIGGAQFEQGRPTPAPPVIPDRWHTLAVDVRPNVMTWSFDGCPARAVVLPLPAADEIRFADSAQLLAGIHPGFSANGGYGLLVSQGAAAFRNARVIPVN